MQRLLKRIVLSILGAQVRQLRKKHALTVIGIVGGIGKTSTKLAIAQVLGETVRVRYQEGNYNDIVSVPLIFFGQELPSLRNPFAWIKIFIDNARQIRGEYPFNVVVVEAGTNKPGDIAAFGAYLKLDYAIVTAIVPEHMAYFDDMLAVAQEELSVAAYADTVFYNADFVPEQYQKLLQNARSYSCRQPATFRLATTPFSKRGYQCEITYDNKTLVEFRQEILSDVQFYYTLAAVGIAYDFGLTRAQLLKGIAAIKPVSGRLQQLPGINGSLIIDDTYNASPEAVKAGMQVLYGLQARRRIAILGNMNELGSMSPDAHREIGELCDPEKVSLVITIGPDANAHLAPAAEARGCTVMRFDNPYAIGKYLMDKIEPDTVIFAKGSQKGVFVEEAIKPLLAHPEDASKLVRQSPYWLDRKQKSFQA